MPTQQFKWIDRDTAARDILQLVYHAPPQIAEQAVKLLKAIRSPAIIPELKAMFLDAEYDIRQRREVYEVICATPGNFDFSEFEPVIGTVVFSPGDLYGLLDLIKNHPINKGWIVHYLEVKPPYPLYYIYSRLIEVMPEIVSERILKMLYENKIPFGLNLGFQLYKFGGQDYQIWLEKNWDSIILAWLRYDLSDEIEYYSLRLRNFIRREDWLNQWPELKSALGGLTPEWVISHIEGESIICQKFIYIRLLPYASSTASKLLLKLFEDKHIFLDLETAGMLHEYGDEVIQNWLISRWDELIYLCLVDGIGIQNHSEKMRIVQILEKWPELKQAVFQNCPVISEEYEEIKTHDNKILSQQVSDNDIKASSIWQAVEKRREAWVEQTEIGLYTPLFSHHLAWNSLRSEADIPNFATETYFLGTILHYNYHYFGNSLRHLLRKSSDQWHEVVTMADDPDMIFVYSPIRFEAAYAIRNMIEPSNWECMVETYLICRNELAETLASVSLQGNLLRWISRMTDMLSGVEPELPDEEIPLNARPWFRALVKQNPS